MDSSASGSSEPIRQAVAAAQSDVRQLQDAYFGGVEPPSGSETEFVSARSPADTWRSTSISGVEDWCSVASSDGATLDDFRSIDDDVAEEFEDDSPDAADEPTPALERAVERLRAEPCETLLSPQLATSFEPQRHSTVSAAAQEAQSEWPATSSHEQPSDGLGEQRQEIAGQARPLSSGQDHLPDAGPGPSATEGSPPPSGRASGDAASRSSRSRDASRAESLLSPQLASGLEPKRGAALLTTAASVSEDVRTSRTREVRTQVRAGDVEKNFVTRTTEDGAAPAGPEPSAASVERVHAVEVTGGQARGESVPAEGRRGLRPRANPAAQEPEGPRRLDATTGDGGRSLDVSCDRGAASSDGGRTDVSRVVYSKEVTEKQTTTSISYKQQAFGLDREEKWRSVEPRESALRDEGAQEARQWQRSVKESKAWIELKIQEMQPAMTDIGDSLAEATELYQQHEKVLEKLQTKQSPVEELLRQADDLISTQKPRGEVYSAMAENLGLAWKDLNAQLDQRRHILEQAVAYFTRAQQFVDSLEVIKRSVADIFLPETVESTATMLLRHQEERKMTLSGAMRLLGESQLLQERLCEVATHSMGDSRPLHMAPAARRTAACVERRTGDLQDRWRLLEALWGQKRARLEQCLLRCQINDQVAEIQDWIRTKSRHDLGDSSASSERLQLEHVEIEKECKEKQEQCLRLVKTAEGLGQSGHYAAEELRSNAYLLLSECSDLYSHLETRRHLLTESISFFKKAQSALHQLDQIEIQVSTSEVQHANLAAAAEDVANAAIRDGRQILDVTGSHELGAQGVLWKVEELERRRSLVTELCRANASLASEKTLAFRKFRDGHEELLKWLTHSGHAFTQRTREMGATPTSAKTFVDQHDALQNDLRMKGLQLEALLRTVPALLQSGGVEVREVHQMADDLRTRFTHFRSLLEKRLLLAQRYLAFLKLAARVTKETDELEQLVQQAVQGAARGVEERQLSLRQEILQTANSGRNFLEDARKVDDPHLNTAHACSTVEEILNGLETRSVTLGTQWLNYQNQMSATRDTLIQREHLVKESHRVIKCAKELEGKMFPVIPKELNRVESILPFLENRMSSLLPQIKSVQKEMESFLKKSETLNLKEDPEGQRMLRELRDMNHGFQKKLSDYQILVSMMTAFFKNFEELGQLVALQESQCGGAAALPGDPSRLEALLRDDAAAVRDLFRFSGAEADRLSAKVDEAEPPAEAAQDREKVCSILADRKRAFEAAWEEYRDRLEQHQQLCTFNRDMQMINQQIEDLRTQLSLMRESYGDSLPSAVHTSEAFVQFEKTIELLQLRIQQFVSTAEGLMRDPKGDQARVQQETRSLQSKWSTFRTQVTHNRRIIDVALEYYRTVEEAEEWLREGGRLLVSVARKSSGCRGEAEADALRSEVRGFLGRGREAQEDRLTKMSALSLQLHGDRPQQMTRAVAGKHRDLLESFSVVGTELAALKVSQDTARQEKVEDAAGAPQAPLRPPRFLRPLTDAEVAEGGRHTFECQVEGDPVPQVQWFKDGLLVENNPDYQTTFEAGLCRLTIEETFSEDTARFSCKATNPAGYAETYCHLVVKESRSQSELVPPHFVQRPADAAAAEGRPLQLECQVSGNPLPLVTWFKDDACIDYSTDYAITYNNGLCTLRVEEAAPEHRGTYVCRAVNPVGQADCSAHLQVCSTVPSEKPSFVVPLSNVMARAGQKLRLECSVTGQPEPEVTWLHNSKPIKETRDTKMHFDGRHATLIITEAFPKDAGTYAVVGRNRAGEGLSSCNVSVKGRLPLETSDSEMASDIEPAKPQVKLHLEDQTVFEGNKVRMDCVIVGQPEPEVIWYHNGKPVKESDDFQLLFEGDRCTLVIKTAYLEDAGAYKCVAINSGGEASSLARLAIQPVKEVEPRSQFSQKDILITVEKSDPPQFLKLLESVAVPENAPLVLSCQVNKEADATLTWFKDSQELTSGAELQIETDEVGASRLTVASAQPRHGGTYSALAQNAAGRAQSFCTASVVAAQPPRFLKHIEDQRVASGESARFETVVTGVPTPEVRWSFQGKGVSGSDGCDGERHWLAVRRVALAHVGRYSAVAENDAGMATTSALLSIADRAAPPMDSGAQEQVAQSMVMMRKKTVVQTSRISSMSEVSDAAEPSRRPADATRSSGGAALPGLPPKFLRPVSTAVVTEGEKLLLEAAYEGSPEPSVTWLKEESELRTGPRLQVTSGGGRTSLFVPKSLTSDGGRYRCVAANAAGRADSAAEVRVKPYREPPKFVRRLQAGAVRSGSRVSFDVQVSGVPLPEVTWFRNGSPLRNTPDFRISSSEGRHSLVIPEVFPDDSGNFLAVARNAAGEARSSADLVVEEDKSPEEDRSISYQHFSSVEHKKEMFTKISMSQSSHVEPYFLPQQEVPNPLPLKKEPEPAQSPSPPPIPAVAAQVWSQLKPVPFPAPAITETQEPVQVPFPEPEETVPLMTSTALAEFQPPVPEAQAAPATICAAVSESFVRQSIMKFSKPDAKQQQQEIRSEDKKIRSFSQQVQQPVIYQNGVDKSTADSISTVTQSSFVSESRSVMTTGVARPNIFDVPRPTKFVPMPMMAPMLTEQFTTDVGATPVWKPAGQELDYTPTWKTVQAPAPVAIFPEMSANQSKATPVELIPSIPLKSLEVKPISIETCSVSSSEIKHVTSQEDTSLSSSEMKPVCFPDSKHTSAQILQMPEKATISHQTLFRAVEPPPPPPLPEATVKTHLSIEHSSQTLPEVSESSFSATAKSTSSSSSQTPLPTSTTESVTKTRTSYSTEEISITKKYEVVVEEQRTESSSTEVATQQPRTISEIIIKKETSDGPLIKTETLESSKSVIMEETAPKSLVQETSDVPKLIVKKEAPDAPKPIIKKQTSDVSPKPKKEVVIEEEPVVGAEVKPPQFSKVRGADCLRKIC